jgi:hypothetical protein
VAERLVMTKARLATTPSDEATALLLRAEKALGSAMHNENLKAETPIETEALLKDNSESSHDIYLAIYKLFERRDKEMGDVFDDFRRSTAFLQIPMMHSRGLLTEQEFLQFSPETRDSIIAIQALGRGA